MKSYTFRSNSQSIIDLLQNGPSLLRILHFLPQSSIFRNRSPACYIVLRAMQIFATIALSFAFDSWPLTNALILSAVGLLFIIHPDFVTKHLLQVSNIIETLILDLSWFLRLDPMDGLLLHVLHPYPHQQYRLPI